MTGKNPEVTHVTEEITPQVAAAYLQHNGHNRPIRERRVRELVNDMAAGRWKENGEAGITFDWNGNIAGGQHTLTAVMRSGVTIRCRVTRGVEPEARATMNDSFKQRFSDDLSLTGVRSAGSGESLLRKILTWEKAAVGDAAGYGGLAAWGYQRFTRAELAEAWPAYAEGVVRTIQDCYHWKRPWSLVGNMGALEFAYWLLVVKNDNNPVTVADYFDRLARGSQDDEDRVLEQVRLKLHKKPNTTPYQVFWLSRGWNAWTRGEKLTKMQLPTGGLSNPFPRLQKAR
jgi:hypothetical protein